MSSFLNPTFLISILIALSIHEAAHAYVAYLLGDHTAKMEGRMTLNPIAHLDPLGTLMFFLVGFGWGKPVPVNPYYFKNPKRDSALTALAGPVSNFLLAFVCVLLLRFLFTGADTSSVWGLLDPSNGGSIITTFFSNLLRTLLFLNLGLMAFNLIPVAPLDGSKILQMFVPLRYELEYEHFMAYGPYILIGLLIAERFLGVTFLEVWIDAIMGYVLRLFSVIVP